LETNEKDIIRKLFSGMPDERLPLNFNENVMSRIRKEALRRERRNRRWEIFGYASAILLMAAVCVFILYRIGVTFEIPEIDLRSAWSFPRPDFSIFKSPSFILSFYVGLLASFLLIVDSIIRRHIEKKHK
jgi:hypothetical protein